MKLKRHISTALAFVLMLALAAPAFASTDLNGSLTTATLNVTVSNTGNVFINPYGLPISLGEVTLKDQQHTTAAPLTIINKSNVDVAVPVKVTTTVPQDSNVNFVQTKAAVETKATVSGSQVLQKNVYTEFQAFMVPP